MLKVKCVLCVRLCYFTVYYKNVLFSCSLCFFPPPSLPIVSFLFFIHNMFMCLCAVYVHHILASETWIKPYPCFETPKYTCWITPIEAGILWDINTISRFLITICSLQSGIINWSNAVLTQKKKNHYDRWYNDDLHAEVKVKLWKRGELGITCSFHFPLLVIR